MKRSALLLAIALSACIDLAGPRPRPGSAPADTTTTPHTTNFLYWEMQPRVLTVGTTDSVRVTVTLDGPANLVYVEPWNGSIVQLAQVSSTVYSGKVPASTMLFNYHTGDLRNAVGWLKVASGSVTTEQPLYVDVKDVTVPTIVPQSVGTGVSASNHVVNIRYDSLFVGGKVPPAVLKTFFSQYADVFNFIAVIEPVISARTLNGQVVRNNIRGLGMPLFDNAAQYGSAANLEMILDYPDEVQFDPAQSSNLRELAHRWMNSSTLSNLAPGKPNWPLSTMANGMTGWSDPQTAEPLNFPFTVAAQNGSYPLTLVNVPRSFNDLEMYLMGLLPADSVGTHLVFLNQNQRAQVHVGGVLQGPVDTVTSARWIAKEGARSPAYGGAPRLFRWATIVLSRGGLLSRDELSYFEYVASRGERQEALTFYNGQASGTTLPFFVATGGRGILTTTLIPR